MTRGKVGVRVWGRATWQASGRALKARVAYHTIPHHIILHHIVNIGILI